MLITAPSPQLTDQFAAVRRLTERLVSRSSGEDQTAQSMPDASPARRHRAHTTWFFEGIRPAPPRLGITGAERARADLPAGERRRR